MLFDELSQIKRIKQKDEKECSIRIDELIKGASELKSQLTNHNRIMSDIKPLLKQMTRYGENSKLYEYSKSYNRFSEMCQNLLRCLSNQVISSLVVEFLKMIIKPVLNTLKDCSQIESERSERANSSSD